MAERSPFAPYNPFLRPSRSLRGNQFGMPVSSFKGTTFSTTNTADYLYAFSGTITIRASANSVLDFSGSVSLKHSAPPASVDIRVFLSTDSAGAAGFYVFAADTQEINDDTLYTNFLVGNMINLAGFSVTPGPHIIGVAVRNNTAGTLAMYDSSGGYSGIVNVLNCKETGYL